MADTAETNPMDGKNKSRNARRRLKQKEAKHAAQENTENGATQRPGSGRGGRGGSTKRGHHRDGPVAPASGHMDHVRGQASGHASHRGRGRGGHQHHGAHQGHAHHHGAHQGHAHSHGHPDHQGQQEGHAHHHGAHQGHAHYHGHPDHQGQQEGHAHHGHHHHVPGHVLHRGGRMHHGRGQGHHGRGQDHHGSGQGHHGSGHRGHRNHEQSKTHDQHAGEGSHKNENKTDRVRSAGNQNRKKFTKFEPYWKTEEVSHGLKRGQLIEGPIRVNPKNFEDSYVPHPDGVSDIYLPGLVNRNRALNQDVVAVLLNPITQGRVLMEDFEAGEPELAEKLATLRSKYKVKLNARSDYITPRDLLYMRKETLPGDQDDFRARLPLSVLKFLAEGKTKEPNGQETAVSDSVTSPAAVTSSDSTESHANDSSEVLESSVTSAPSDQSDAAAGTPVTSPPAIEAATTNDPPATNSQREPQRASPGVCPEADERYAAMLSIPCCYIQRTGKVVAIIERKHSRAATGHLKPLAKEDSVKALFHPRDHRVPRIMIPLSDCPAKFKERPSDFERSLFVARITEWRENSVYADGYAETNQIRTVPNLLKHP